MAAAATPMAAAMTTTTAATVTAAAMAATAANQDEVVLADRAASRAGGFEPAIDLRLGGLLRDRRDHQSAHQRRDRNCNQCIFHDVSLLARAAP
jgi:hypothetical protein